jgi:hypothetical protein
MDAVISSTVAEILWQEVQLKSFQRMKDDKQCLIPLDDL